MVKHSIFKAFGANLLLEVFLFLFIYLKRLIEFGMTVSFTKSRVVVLMETSLIIFRYQASKSCLQWSMVRLEIGYSWRTTRFSFQPAVFLICINDLLHCLTIDVMIFHYSLLLTKPVFLPLT